MDFLDNTEMGLNINSSSQMRWLLKGMEDGSLIGLLHITPKTHLWVSDQSILDLRWGARVIYPLLK